MGAIDAAEAVCDNIYHLFVTCNKNGALSKRAATTENCYAINLTDETHDQSFAMTSSYSNMYLATYLCFHLNELDKVLEKVRKIGAAGQAFLDNKYGIAQQIVDNYDFERIVYLGSNTLKGTSQESALKMLELTAGRVVTMYDTPMGFRHGPKSIVDDTTLTVVYLSDDPYTRQYEVDLIKEMSGQRKGNKIVAVMRSQDDEVASLVDYTVSYDLEDSYDFEGMMEGKDAHEEISRKVVACFSELYPGDKLILSGDGCDRCEQCTYPDAPCRFGNEVYPTVESYGVEVYKLAETVPVNYINGPNTVTYFGCILY